MNSIEKSMNTLELPRVLERLAEYAQSVPGRALCSAIRPNSMQDQVEERLEEVEGAKKMLFVKGAPSFHAVVDVKKTLERAKIGGTLNPKELLAVAGVCREAVGAKKYAKEEGVEETGIDYLFSCLVGCGAIEQKISRAIVAEDEIADAASADLADIRRKIKQKSGKIGDTLRKMISSTAYSKVLQDAIVTQRGGRYVVPVKSEHKSAVEGLVHDTSSSGATFFIEPKAVVEANNEIRELQAKEKIEIERILMELSGQVGDSAEDIKSDFELLVRLDEIFARAKFAIQLNCTKPGIALQGELRLKKARHPLLDPKQAVANDIILGEEYDTLVITGPNTGGKTVSIKTLGLLCLMAQCGLHIPAQEGSILPLFSQVLADIGDEQSIEQSLSTFSGHMKNIVEILRDVGPGSLLLFDELGAGTDPTEGAALAISIIEHARSCGAMVAATTHYAELKVYATQTPGVVNAACEFDLETLRPTYRLLIGIPGKSNAFAIAGRLGLKEVVIEDARRRIDENSASFEEVLEKLDETRQEMERERKQADQLLLSARADKEKTDSLRREMEAVRARAHEQARREAQEIIEEARRASDEVFEELKRLQKEKNKQDDWQSTNEARSGLRRKLNEAGQSLEEIRKEEVHSRPIKVGDTVEIGQGTKAQVLSIGKDGTLSLQAGILKVTAKSGEVRLLEGETKQDFKKVIAKSEAKLRSAGVKPELDLRGMMVEEAVAAVEQFLDMALMVNLETVTIIHGKGTGALRAAVHESLKRSRQVKEYRLGRYGEGETGVTIVKLK